MEQVVLFQAFSLIVVIVNQFIDEFYQIKHETDLVITLHVKNLVYQNQAIHSLFLCVLECLSSFFSSVNCMLHFEHFNTLYNNLACFKNN